MPTDEAPDRSAPETQPLLGPEDRDYSDQQSGRSNSIFESSAWIRAALYAASATNAAIQDNYSYVLLVFLPLGIAATTFGWPPITVLIFNLTAIIPLSALVSYSSDELSIYVGDLVGELINATFGNVVELSVGVLALFRGEKVIVQSTMLGSILSDILFVLGSCMFYAAYGDGIPEVNKAMADVLSSLMIITATALILPTALSIFSDPDSSYSDSVTVAFSRGSAIVLLALYAMYLYFELKTHNYFFLGASNDGINTNEESNLDEEHQEPRLSRWSATAILFSATVGIIGCTHLFLDSVQGTADTTGFTKRFIAAILIPIASNAPECATVMVASRNGRVDFAIGVVVGSILQIALFVIPILVILGWIIQQEMTLSFEPFQTIMLFLAVLVVNRLLQDGKYTYVQGAMLVALYAVVVNAYFLRPETL